jgi:hypothetical protein
MLSISVVLHKLFDIFPSGFIYYKHMENTREATALKGILNKFEEFS